MIILKIHLHSYLVQTLCLCKAIRTIHKNYNLFHSLICQPQARNTYVPFSNPYHTPSDTPPSLPLRPLLESRLNHPALQPPSHLSAKLLATTQRLLPAIAALPHTGLNLHPSSLTLKHTPAATGIKMTLYTTAHPKLNFTRLNTLSDNWNRVITDSREEERRMNEEEWTAMSDAEDREMETSAVLRAGASLMPSPMNAIVA